MDFLATLIGSILKVIILSCGAGFGIFLGMSLRKRKNNKKSTIDKI